MRLNLRSRDECWNPAPVIGVAAGRHHQPTSRECTVKQRHASRDRATPAATEVQQRIVTTKAIRPAITERRLSECPNHHAVTASSATLSITASPSPESPRRTAAPAVA